MEWIAGLQRAIDYVEAHLTEEIDYEAVAKEACSSVFHFQRVFGVICGFTLGDYIRMRRLFQAASDLSGTKDKVVDIALPAPSPDSMASRPPRRGAAGM